MVVSNAHEKFGFLHISFYKIVQIVLPIIKQKQINKIIINSTRSARPKPFFDFRRADFDSTAVQRGWDIVSLFLIRAGQGEVKYAAYKSKNYEDCF